MTIKVNVHPRHTIDSAVHIPYIGNSYNRASVEAFLKY